MPAFITKRFTQYVNTDIMSHMANKNPMTKSQVLAELSEQTGLTKKDAGVVLETIVALACKEAKSSGKFTLPGLGILKLAKSKARMGRNPATGEAIKIPAKTRVKFTVSKAAKDVILGNAKKK